jgi:glycerol 2-dehydrogenase (NADP+)
MIKLNDGNVIPKIGLGTWQSKTHEVEHAVEYAVKEAGYRHIDCAWVYANEEEVGIGLKNSGVPREDVFITSKVWGTFHNNVAAGLQESLDNLGVTYLDLYLMHWPVALNPDVNFSRRPTPGRYFR